MNAVAEKTTHPLVVFKQQLDARETEFKAALPAHIPAERFARVVMTAVQNNPDLMGVERRSLFNAAIKSAQDGLLPDGREAALVVYSDFQRGKIAQYMPMIAGLRKKVRNSGEIATWDVDAVYENDEFDFEKGDNPFIRHKPALRNRGELIAVYSIATLKSGEKSRDVMGIDDVNRIRDRSIAWKAFKSGKIKSTPWSTDYEEMSKKTVARRHSKVLPMSSDLDDLIRRDDDLYNFDAAKAEGQHDAGPRLKSLAGKLDALAAPAHVVDETVTDGADPETGEIADAAQPSDASTAPAEAPPPAAAPDADDDPINDAQEPEHVTFFFDLGQKAARAGSSRKAMPAELRAPGRESDAAEWVRGYDGVHA